MDVPGLDEHTVHACQRYKILSQHILTLENECTQLKGQLKDLKKQYDDLQKDAAERKLYTSMMETNNRSNERRLKELKQEINRLNKSNKRLMWEYQDRIKKIKEEHIKQFKEQEAKFQNILDNMTSQNRLVVRGLKESIDDKNATISSALQYFMTMHRAQTEALMAFAQSSPESNGLLKGLKAIEARKPENFSIASELLKD